MQNAPEGLRALVSSLFPGAAIEKVAVLGPDVAEGDTEKVEGYGRPIRVTVHEPAGWRREIVFRTATPNDFGHDRRADRAEGLLLANDLFAQIPEPLRLRLEGAAVVLGDAPRLRQVLYNLMKNAVDAMPGGGTVRLSAQPAEESSPGGRWWEIRFQDSGQGIPADLLGQVFRPMFTTKPEGRGTGLGLSICREIVRSHGGEIRIESAEGRGTAVVFTLPGARP